MIRRLTPALLLLTGAVAAAQSADPSPYAAGGRNRVEPTLVSRVSIIEPATIERLIGALDLFTLDPSTVTGIDIYDLTRNGFGAGDVALVHPTEEIRIFSAVGPELRAEMATWQGAQQHEQHFSAAIDPDSLELLHSPHAGIAAGVMRAVERNYGRELPFGLVLTSDGKRKAVFEMWGFEADSLRYRPPETGEGRTHYDLIDIVRRQTEVIADSVAYDLLFIRTHSTDTLYLPPPRSRATTNKGAPGSDQR
jgi:hypothetical protein